MDVFSLNDEEASLKLAERYSFQCVEQIPQTYYLCYDGGVLKVKNPNKGKNFSISIDFDQEFEKLRRQRLGFKKDLLCRAVGFQGQDNYCVLDTTLGFAKDAAHLMSLGCKIIGLEKDPVVSALLEDAYLRSEEARSLLTLHHCDGQQFLKQNEVTWDCLYIDPMFEDVQSKTQPKKNMAFLRDWQNPENPEDWVPSLIENSDKRVVVKRPLKGGKLGLNPISMLEGKLIRFDIYKGRES